MTRILLAAATLALGAAALAPTTASAGGYGYRHGYTVYVAPTPYIYVAPKRYYKHYYAPKHYGYTYGGYGY